MEKVNKRIAQIHKDKNISHEAMAYNLGISQAAYTKLEKNDTKLTVERLYKICEVLETKIKDILDIHKNTVYHQKIKDNGVGHQRIENLYQENQQMQQELLLGKENLIEKQAQEILFLRSLLQKEGK